jgi:uncharacterized protein DUF2817
MNPVPHFAQSYVDARDKFIAAGRARRARILRQVHPSEYGAQGEELSIDIAQIGGEDAPAMLLLSSGTHGVEGFCGSGCQVALLHDEAFLAEVERSGVGVMMLHALNPYGFSHLQRTNEENADLNRNFVDFSAPLPDGGAYSEVHALLLPPEWPPSADNEAMLKAWADKHGAKAFQAAISGGQYAFPDGMFYGGSAPSWSNLTLRAVLRGQGAPRSRLGWIDFHTGLGPRGHAEKIYAGHDDAADIARAKACWGREVTSFFDGSSTSARVSGVICNAAYDECPHTQLIAMALEYGTYPLEHTLQALRAGHWLRNHPEAPPEQQAEIRRALRDTFYIDADDWKTMVYEQARAACLQAIASLATVSAPTLTRHDARKEALP